MPVDWIQLYNRLFKRIDTEIDTEDLYFSEPKFIEHVKIINPDFPDYCQYMEIRKK